MSESSALSLAGGSLAPHSLIVLDLLRAATDHHAWHLHCLDDCHRIGMLRPSERDCDMDRRVLEDLRRRLLRLQIVNDFCMDTLTDDIQHIVSRSKSNISGADDADTKAVPAMAKAEDYTRRIWRLKAISRELNSNMRDAEDALSSMITRTQSNADSARSTASAVRGKQSTISTWLIGVLLPLILSSSVLGMSTRAKHLHSLWFDFFGLFFVLALAALVTGRAFSWFSYAQKFFLRVTNIVASDGIFEMIDSDAWKWFYLRVLEVFAYIVVASFLAGMVKDIELGSTMLAFGAAAVGLLVFVSVFLYLVLLLQDMYNDTPSRRRIRADAGVPKGSSKSRSRTVVSRGLHDFNMMRQASQSRADNESWEGFSDDAQSHVDNSRYVPVRCCGSMATLIKTLQPTRPSQ